MYLGTIIASIIGYFLGSISFSIIIVYIKTKNDIREHGSKNAGATNVSRVLGKKWGILIMTLDMTKVFGAALIAMALNVIPNELFDRSNFLIPAFFAVLGHCYPIYYKFKGGKAVSCFFAMCLLLNIFLFVLFFVIFMIIAMTSKKISPASIATAVIITSLSFVPQVFGMTGYYLSGVDSFNNYYNLTYLHAANLVNWGHELNNKVVFYDSLLSYEIIMLLSAGLLIFKHRQNIVRLCKGEEPNFFACNREEKIKAKQERERIVNEMKEKAKIAS